MSLAVLRSRALAGMSALPVTVEVHLANGLPAFTIVGLPDTEVKEARDRVRAALQNARFEFPARRITINLAPADLPKESGRFDLAMALGILAASGQIPADRLDEHEYAGELSLSGQLLPIRGALAMTCAIQRDTQAHGETAGHQRSFILPAANADEAALVPQACILPATSLLDVCAHFSTRDQRERLQPHQARAAAPRPAYPDFSDIKGQWQARRAMEVAAAGQHSMLLVGPPGAGKSMLATRFPGILPPMTQEQALESAAVQSLSGSFDISRWQQRPFRAPHHTASAVALVGGGSTPRPGEISLAHHGVLFLDEIAEYPRSVLDVLRQPMESGRITISRAARQAEFPARFQLVAAMNPCPCGLHGEASGRCRCTPELVRRYQARLSGPLLDRIDMQLQVGALSPAELAAHQPGEPSAAIAPRVALAFERQLQRQGKPNSQLSGSEIDRYCQPDQAASQLLQAAMVRLEWSARAYHRVLKLARTIADLATSDALGQAHVAEAIQYRRGLADQ
ncbi:magnesium chelatase family protein [Herbaspirillum rubrisubalbicans]|uniref:YifB family Mg chelatase-like AAA ATPase n=2 Tax=Herbaspirillum rubrisubalbicans TaxID=80842 RepID=UPI00209D3D3A|nr:YifB family Mg chelatase-like AAA ATPase [Herbaspirillum rubrisubalbicans]MCP1575456.1 magnesium chelatase family protein [Herbaspirillum rubrisubalbicans]